MVNNEYSFPLRTADNKLTFAGAVQKFFPEIAEKRWNVNTQLQYTSNYRNLLEQLPPYKALEEYSGEDLENALQYLQKDNGKYADSTLRHYRYLINVVVDKAVENKICTEFRQGTVFAIQFNEDGSLPESEKKRFSRIHKSLTPEQNIWLIHYFLDHLDTMPGQMYGLVLMFLCGMRNNEVCAINFGDIYRIPQCDADLIRVYKSTEKDRKSLKGSGKTANANRVIPMMKIASVILNYRRNKVIEALKKENPNSGTDAEEMVNSMPVSSLEGSFTRRCNADDLSRAARKLFSEMPGFDIDCLTVMDAEIYENSITKRDIEEKEPTAYLFRHNFASMLYTLGFTMPDIQFLIGHDIERTDLTRNDYMNEDILINLAQKMQNAPINRVFFQEQSHYIYRGENGFSVDTASADIEFRCSGNVELRIIGREPWAGFSVSIPRNAKNLSLTVWEESYEPSWDIDVHSVIEQEYIRINSELPTA